MTMGSKERTERDEIIRLLKGLTTVTLLLLLGALAVGAYTGELQDILSGRKEAQ